MSRSLWMATLLIAATAVVGCGKDGGDTGHDDHTDGGTTDGGTTDGGTGNTGGGTDGGTTDGGTTDGGTDGGTTDGGTTDGGTTPGTEPAEADGLDNDGDGLVDEESWVVGDIVFTEVMLKPHDVSDDSGQWIEVLNTSERAVNLVGLLLIAGVGAEGHTIEHDVWIEPGARAVLGPNADWTLNGGVDIDYQYRGIVLDEYNASLSMLVGPVLLDETNFSADELAEYSGASLNLDPYYEVSDLNDSIDAWCPATRPWDLGEWGESPNLGTPGAPNDECARIDHDEDGQLIAEGDCDDYDPAVNTSAAEVYYDGVDQNCDGFSDYDADEDGWDHSDYGGLDCDDSRLDIKPLIEERCDEVDNDCDGAVDESDATDAPRWYLDADSDGYGLESDFEYSCTEIKGRLEDFSDCDDGNDAVNPAATEVCGDGLDNDCSNLNDCGADGVIDLSVGGGTALVGESSGDDAGASVSWAGDVDGDGLGEVLVGAPYADPNGSSSGIAYLVSPDQATAGAAGARLDLANADARFLGGSSIDFSGFDVAGVGDADDDGYDDLLIGAYYQDIGNSDAGAAFLIQGPVTGNVQLDLQPVAWIGGRSSDSAGSALSSAGDVNDDGYADYLIGAYQADGTATNSGAVYLVLGPGTAGGSLDSGADAKFIGEGANDYLGSGDSLGTADVNGDGFSDMLMGAYRNDHTGSDVGAAYVVYGPITGNLGLVDADAKLYGEANNDIAGLSVAGAGDTNNDGLDDFIVGADENDRSASDAGAAYLVLGQNLSGAASLASADAVFTGASGSDAFGYSVSGAGDVNGDGSDDLLIGAFGEDTNGDGAGAAYLIYGPVTGTVEALAADGVYYGAGSSDDMGYSVSGAGDVDDDGYDDILLGSPDADLGGSITGAAYLLYGGEGL